MGAQVILFKNGKGQGRGKGLKGDSPGWGRIDGGAVHTGDTCKL